MKSMLCSMMSTEIPVSSTILLRMFKIFIATVFILIASWAFSKCSTRFTIYLENHKIFGPIITNWQIYKGLSRRAKKMAILMIIPTFIFTIYIAFNLVGDLIFGLFGIVLCTWLAKRPEPPVRTD